MDSILKNIRYRVVSDEDDTSFDADIIDLINSAFADLNDIGVGPSEGFSIENDQDYWEDFSDDVRVLSSVKEFVYLTVKLTFDPPTQTSLLTSMENKLKKLEWRLNAKCDST